MIYVTAMRLKNSFYLKIKRGSRKSKRAYLDIAALYAALLAVAEKDEGVISLKNSCTSDIARLSILGGKYTEGAFNMAIEGIRETERKYPKNVEFNERMNSDEKP